MYIIMKAQRKNIFEKEKKSYLAESIALLRMLSQAEDFLKQNTTVEILK